MWYHAAIRQRLNEFIQAVGGSPVFRRKVHFQGDQAFAAYGLTGPAIPDDGLPTRHYRVSCILSDQALFMPALTPLARASDIPFAMRLVLYGVRPMALIHGQADHLASLLRWAEQTGLYSVFSPTAFMLSPEDGKGDYNNLALNPHPFTGASTDVSGAILVASDLNRAILGYLAMLFGWDEYLGRLLGYPDCCARAFVDRWPQAKTDYQGDVAAILALESTTSLATHSFNPHLNIYGRYFGCDLLSHFPCSFQCKPSIQQAERIAAVLAALEPDYLRSIEHFLDSLVLFTATDGITLFAGVEPDSGDGEWRVTSINIRSTNPDALSGMPKGKVTLKRSPDGVDINGRKLKGRLLDFRVPETRQVNLASL